jgi:hypothetical protein
VANESGVANTVDPPGGPYYVEALNESSVKPTHASRCVARVIWVVPAQPSNADSCSPRGRNSCLARGGHCLAKCRQDVLGEGLDCIEAFISTLNWRLEDEVIHPYSLGLANILHDLLDGSAER